MSEPVLSEEMPPPHSAAVPEERRALLALLTVPGLGPRRLARLLAHCGTPQAVLGAEEALWRAVGLNDEACAALRQPDWRQVERALAWATGDHTWIMTRADPDYPPLLAEIAAPPPVLFGRGDRALVRTPQIAIVGTRQPSAAGREIAFAFARHLAAAGFTVTSGLALGIDSAAHRGALSSGRTVAVLGTGPDRVYPAAHHELAVRIAASGALVTEFFPGTGPHATHFPRRNRIVSGLSHGTVVVEAGLDSGALITARHALEQGREVFAVPGSIHNPQVRGCHALIREGAKLVDCPEQIIEELLPQLHPLVGPAQALPWGEPPPAAAASHPAPRAALDPEQQHLLACFGPEPTAPDELIARTGWPAPKVIAALLLLELHGYVSSEPGGRYRRHAC